MRMARWSVLAFALVYPTVMTWLYFTGSGGNMQLLYGIGKVIQFALPALWWAAVDRNRLRIAAPRFKGVATGVDFGVFVGAGILAIYFGWLRYQPQSAALDELASAKAREFGLTTPAKFLMFAVFLCAIHALLEEFYWRAFVFAELRKNASVAPAIVVSSLGFMAHHIVVLDVYFPGHFWQATVPMSAAVAIGGAAWAIMYERNGSLYPGWVSHALVDAALMGVAYAILWR
jgi:uncharacterized protein